MESCKNSTRPATQTASAPDVSRADLPQVETQLCIMGGEEHHVPDCGKALLARPLPAGAPVPHRGDVVYLTSTSAWGVSLVVHEWLAGGRLRIEVWLEYVGAGRETRPGSCTLIH